MLEGVPLRDGLTVAVLLVEGSAPGDTVPVAVLLVLGGSVALLLGDAVTDAVIEALREMDTVLLGVGGGVGAGKAALTGAKAEEMTADREEWM